MKISKDKFVSINYTLKDESGQVLDSSEGRQPLGYLHGSGQIIPGLEKVLEGTSTGEDLSVVIPADEGYGQRDESLVYEVPKTEFETPEELEIGMQFRVGAEGGNLIVAVAGVGDDTVILDGNHPLAGMDLAFDVSVVDVREATKEELEMNQHVHGSGCEC